MYWWTWRIDAVAVPLSNGRSSACNWSEKICLLYAYSWLWIQFGFWCWCTYILQIPCRGEKFTKYLRNRMVVFHRCWFLAASSAAGASLLRIHSRINPHFRACRILSLSLSVCVSVYLYVCLYVCMSVCLYVCMYVYLYVCLSVCMSVCMSLSLSLSLIHATCIVRRGRSGRRGTHLSSGSLSLTPLCGDIAMRAESSCIQSRGPWKLVVCRQWYTSLAITCSSYDCIRALLEATCNAMFQCYSCTSRRRFLSTLRVIDETTSTHSVYSRELVEQMRNIFAEAKLTENTFVNTPRKFPGQSLRFFDDENERLRFQHPVYDCYFFYFCSV